MFGIHTKPGGLGYLVREAVRLGMGEPTRGVTD